MQPFIYSYLKRRKQNVKIHDIFSSIQTLLSEVPQGSVLGPMLINIFLNDLLAVLIKSQLYNFADDNTISQKRTVLKIKKFKKKNQNQL